MCVCVCMWTVDEVLVLGTNILYIYIYIQRMTFNPFYTVISHSHTCCQTSCSHIFACWWNSIRIKFLLQTLGLWRTWDWNLGPPETHVSWTWHLIQGRLCLRSFTVLIYVSQGACPHPAAPITSLGKDVDMSRVTPIGGHHVRSSEFRDRGASDNIWVAHLAACKHISLVEFRLCLTERWTPAASCPPREGQIHTNVLLENVEVHVPQLNLFVNGNS